jgi:pimeloyl-ACP methyl ester carboxylesterase
MRAWISRRKLTRAAAAVGALLFALLALRAWDAEQGPPLRPWHTVVPEELHAAALDTADWAVWLAAEQAALDTVRTQVTERIAPEDRIAANRYFAGSPLHPGRFPRDWNRSFVLLPEGEPRGAVALLHGLTDAPYSLRHVAQRYRALGFVAVGLRLPGHGTVPAGLTAARWEDWMAATRLAVREARARTGPGRPIHLIGYSNGGALALKHALDALEDPRLPRAERLVLIGLPPWGWRVR